jgi:hypothetical protein
MRRSRDDRGGGRRLIVRSFSIRQRVDDSLPPGFPAPDASDKKFQQCPVAPMAS